MKTYKSLIILVLVSLFTSSCEDFFDMAIDLDIEEHKSKIAITSFFSDQNINEVLVSYSIGGTEEAADNQLLTNANVILSQGNTSYELNHSENDGIYQLEGLIDFIPNKEYTLTVEAANYTTVSSKQIFPQEVAIIEATIDSEKLSVRFKDTPNVRNYYILVMQAFHPDYEINSHIYMEDESNFQNSSSQRGILISDETFEGNEIVINAGYWMNKVDDYENDPEPTLVKAILYNITEDIYKYDISYRNNYTDDPFTEPVILHRNIENGYGIFGMMNANIFEIDLTK